ncbi:MAG: permease [Bradymonadia bacterium]
MYTFGKDVWMMAVMMTPWLVIGAFCVAVLHLVLPPGFFERALSGRGGVFKSVLFGVPLPLCSCAVIPVAMGMNRGGAPKSSTVAFLVSTPQTGVDSILVTGGFLGWPFAIYRVVVAAVMGIGAGFFTARLEVEPSITAVDERGTVKRHGIRDSLDHAWMSLESIWGWVLIGVMVSALIGQSDHHEVFTAVGLSQLNSILLALAVSIPLYVCATASIPIAASLVSVGFPVEAALVFLIAGPATNTATIGAVYKTLGRKVTTVYLSITILGSVAFAYLFSLIVPSYAIPQIGAEHVHHTVWDLVFGAAFVLISVAWLVSLLRSAKSEDTSDVSDMKQTVSVEGMTCQGCVKRLQRALDDNELTAGAIVSLPPGQVFFNRPLQRLHIETVVKSSGFSVNRENEAVGEVSQ